LKIFFACLFATALFAASANASTILQLIIDPVSEADTGVAPVNGMLPTSSRVGAGNYHLYAVDDNAGSFGLSSYNILVNGASTSLHRSPTTAWNDPDANGPFNAGFSLLRSSNNQAPIGTFQGSQPLPGSQPALIANIGKTTGNFPDAISGEDPAAFALTTSGQWGTYAAALNLAPVNGNNWVLIGEGQYSSTPSIGTAAVVTYFNENFASLASEVIIRDPCLGMCGGPPPGEAPIVNDLDFLGVDTTVTPAVSGTVTLANPGTVTMPVNWGNFQFVSYTPGFGGMATPSSSIGSPTATLVVPMSGVSMPRTRLVLTPATSRSRSPASPNRPPSPCSASPWSAASV
jgi:hypothetical protein